MYNNYNVVIFHFSCQVERTSVKFLLFNIVNKKMRTVWNTVEFVLAFRNKHDKLNFLLEIYL